MPIFTMEIGKRAVMAFSGNYSLKADRDQVPFFNMLKRDLRESLFDPGTGKPIWDGITRSQCGWRRLRKCKPGATHVSPRNAMGL
jgi:hypothetical protein